MPKARASKRPPNPLWVLLDDAWQEAEERRLTAQSFSLPGSLIVQEDQLTRLSLTVISLNTSCSLRLVIDNSH